MPQNNKTSLLFPSSGLISYQVKMMMHQEKAAGYAVSMVEEDGSAYLDCRLPQTTTLEEHLAGRRLGGETFLKILRDLSGQIANGIGYFLDEDRWLLEFDRIFHDGNRACMLYVPSLEASRDMGQAWGLLIDRFLPYLDREDARALQVNQSLRVHLEGGSFDRTAFHRLLEELHKTMDLKRQING